MKPTFTLKTRHVSVFTGTDVLGNPAGVVLVGKHFPEADVMADIAIANGYPETAFVSSSYWIRYYSQSGKPVNFCGHATLASAAVLHHEHGRKNVEFRAPGNYPVFVEARKGHFEMRREVGFLRSVKPEQKAALAGIGLPTEDCIVSSARDLMVQMPSSDSVRNFVPDFGQMKEHGIGQLVLVHIDKSTQMPTLTVRYFAPDLGIPEDPATGSIAGYLAQWLNTDGQIFLIRQASPRGGVIQAQLIGDTTFVSGQCSLHEGPIAYP